MRVIGIDPGITGGWAVLDSDGSLIAVGHLPVSGDAKHRMVSGALLRGIIDEHQPDRAIIELVSAMPKQGVSSSFKFGRAFGIAQGVVEGAMLPLTLVSAAVWKKAMRLTSDKEMARQLAIRTWPAFASSHFARKLDKDRAEAALLALYSIEASASQSPRRAKAAPAIEPMEF